MESLPDGIVHSILSFCEYKDTLSVAALSSQYRHHVEVFSASRREQMRQAHQPDPRWDQRLVMHASRPLQYVPDGLSERHLLKVAEKTSLYSLNGNAFRAYAIVTWLDIHPSGDMLICDDDTLHILVWDLTTRQCVRIIKDGQAGDGQLSFLRFAGEHIVAGRLKRLTQGVYHTIYVYTIDGTLIHSIRASYIYDHAICGNKLFAISEDEVEGQNVCQYFLSVLDVPSGEYNRSDQPIGAPSQTYYGWSTIIAAGDWLVVQFFNRGLFVYNQSDLVQVSLFPGKICSVEKRSEDGNCFVAIARQRKFYQFYTMSIVDGQIVPLHSFTSQSYFLSVVVLSNKSYFHLRKGERQNTIIVLDTKTGDLLRSLTLPSANKCKKLVTNGRELFCAVGKWEASYTIKAYPA